MLLQTCEGGSVACTSSAVDTRSKSTSQKPANFKICCSKQMSKLSESVTRSTAGCKTMTLLSLQFTPGCFTDDISHFQAELAADSSMSQVNDP